MFNNYIDTLETNKHLNVTLTDLQYQKKIELTCNNEFANQISFPIEEVLIKEEIANNSVFQDGNVLDGDEAMEENDKFSELENPENIHENMQYSSSLYEERRMENFLNRVKKETGLNLIPEEIQIKDECLFEAIDSDSKDKSKNKLQNEGTNKPVYNLTLSEVGKNRGMDHNVDSAKRHKCDKCHKAFTYPSLLKIHNRIHTGERPFECTTCKKTFTTVINLKRHNREHTGEKPYECDICNQKFTRNGYLKVHKQIHNNERPFKCSVCRNSFTQSSHLSQHMRIHTEEKPLKCELCQYMCAQTSNLKKHMRIHTGEKPFQCLVCQYKCAQTSDLKRHMRIHTGEKQFTCKHCQKVFGRGLKRHMQTMHGDKI